MQEWSELLRLIGPTSTLAGWVTFHSLVPLPPVPPIPPMVLQLLNRASVTVRRLITGIDVIGAEITPSGRDTLVNPNWWRHLRLSALIGVAWLETMPLRLRHLEVDRCTVPTQLLTSAPCRTLRQATLFWCDAASIERVAQVSTLRNITLQRCQSIFIDQLQSLAFLPSLTTLNFLECTGLASVGFLAGSTSLTELSIWDAGLKSEGLVGLERIPTSKKIALLDRHTLVAVNCLAKSKSLEQLHLFYCNVTTEGLQGLECVPTLKSLELSFCSGVTSVAFLAASSSLETLDLTETTVDGWTAVARLPTLRSLVVPAHCSTVNALADSISLETLDLSSSKVTSEGLAGLECIPTLTKLNLSHCRSVTSVSCLAQSRSLKHLFLAVTSVTSEGIAGLERIPTLRSLDVSGCATLTSVHGLVASPSLVRLSVDRAAISHKSLNKLVACRPTLVVVGTPTPKRPASCVVA